MSATVPEPERSSVGRRQLLWSLLLLGAMAVLALLTRPLTPIDETRYVGVAWEMWVAGDGLVPLKNGQPYSDKPPLMFWLIHAGWHVFGVSLWWPRLLLPIFSAGGLGLTYLLARRLWPEQDDLGGMASLVLVSSLLWLVFSTMVMFDVLLAFWVLVGAHGILSAAEDRYHGFVLLGIGIGLGALAKGPVILLHLLPMTVLAPWWSPGIRWGRWCGGLALAVGMGAAIGLAWAIPAGLAGGEAYRSAIFLEQTAQRVTGSFAHQRPVWWYLPLLPLMLFPWFGWPELWTGAARRGRAELDRGMRFSLAWMLPVFVLFSLISGKQPHYLIPLFPAFALLTARVLAEGSTTRIALPALLAAVLGGALVLAASGHVAAVSDELAVLPAVWPGAVLLLLAGAAWIAARRGLASGLTLALLGVTTVALVQLAGRRVINEIYDVEPMARAIGKLQEEGRTVANVGTYHSQYHFLGRLEAPLVELSGTEAVRWLSAHPEAFAVVYVRDPEDLVGIPALHTQPYRGRNAALVEARAATRLLAPRRDRGDRGAPAAEVGVGSAPSGTL